VAELNSRFSFKDRPQIIEASQGQTYDLIIIGGGINGAGAARDAARRGLSVLCLEKSDLASGTSSRSSKLAHGGLRYLENFEFRLVFEALNERNHMLKAAPHMVHPLEFIIPMYEGDRVSPLKMKMGMLLYDMLALFGAPKSHSYLSPAQTVARVKNINARGLKGAFAYSDAYMDDDRLVVEAARDACRFGAHFLTYFEFQTLDPQTLDQQVKVISATDVFSGKSYNFKARHILTTVGPWTDIVAAKLLPDWKPRMRPTKGVHLTLNRLDFPIDDAVVMAADKQKRIIFAIPRQEMVIIGTTDTDFKADPTTVNTENADVDYLIKILEEYFPLAKIDRSRLIASYSGVRPLVDEGHNKVSESKVSRDHVIVSDKRGVTFLMGGKYTTYRLMCEEAVNEVLKHFTKAERSSYKKCSTKDLLNPKINVKNYVDSLNKVSELVQKSNLSHLQVKMLVERHGPEAWDMLLDQKFDYVWEYEAMHALEHTNCANLLDFYTRRVPLFLGKKDHGFKFIKRVGQVFQNYFGWTDEQLELEIQKVFNHSKSELGWKDLTDVLQMDKIEYI
jgi:glycerol-3-phosphate dehydrogenase